MIDTKTASQILEITPQRFRGLIQENNIPIVSTGKGRGSKIEISPSAFRQILNLRDLGFEKTIATIGQEKGGVGKSLLTFNIAVNLSKKGARVLIIDLDPEACITNLIIKPREENFSTIYEVMKHDSQIADHIEPTKHEGIDILGCKGVARRVDRLVADANPKKLLKNKMKGLDHYDLILFDIPPSFSKMISSAYLSSDIVVMPTFPDAWSIESLQLTIDDIGEDCDEYDAKIPEIKILRNKFLEHRNASKDALDVLTTNYTQYLLPYQIKDSAFLQNSINDGKSLFEVKGEFALKEMFSSISNIICPLLPLKNQLEN